MKIICPGCKQTRLLPRVEEGRRIECSCGERFQLERAMIVEDIDEPVPVQIGPCKIEAVIGMGGMGRVYRSTHPSLGIPVAIKVLQPELAAIPSFAEHFISTARLSAKLDHPNIVRTYDCGKDKEQVYLVMEYVAGGTVQDLLDEWECLEPGAAVEIGIAVCNALAEAAKCGIVHRDIKPDNVMRAEDGVFKLSDLGLAYRIAPGLKAIPQAVPVQNESKPVGTPHYMAPEQAISPESSDLRADIYSLGITLYQLVTGRLPYIAKDNAEMRRLHAEAAPPLPSSLNPRIPAKLDQIILRCMAKKPADRYQSPQDLRAELECLRSKTATTDYHPLDAPKDGESSSASFRPELSITPNQSRKPLLSWPMILTLVAAITTCSFVWFWNFDSSKTPNIPPPVPGETKKTGTAPEDATIPSSTQKGPSEARTANSETKSETDAKDEKIWEFALSISEKTAKEKTGYDEAISNFEAIRDAAGRHSKEAAALIGKLREERELSAREALASLSEKARPFIASHDLTAVARLYGEYDGPGSKETVAARRKVSDAAESKARAIAEEREKAAQNAAETERQRAAEAELQRQRTLASLAPLIMQGKLSEALRELGESPADPALKELSDILVQTRDAEKSLCAALAAEAGNTIFLEIDGRKKIITIKQVKDGKIQAEISEGSSSFTIKFDVQTLSFPDRYRYLDRIDKRARALYSALEYLRNRHLNIAEKYIPGTGPLLAPHLMAKLAELQEQDARRQAQTQLAALYGIVGLRASQNSPTDTAATLARIKILKGQAEEIRAAISSFRSQYEKFAAEEDCRLLLKVFEDAAIEALKRYEAAQDDKNSEKPVQKKIFKIKNGDDLYSAIITSNPKYNGRGKIRFKTGSFFVDLSGAEISDISCLENLPIKTLALNANPEIKDLSPVRNCPLEMLSITGCSVDDLTPILSIRLKNLSFSPAKITNAESLRMLRGMSSLENISADNDPPTQSAAEFWRKFDAGAYTQKNDEPKQSPE